jgi:ATP-dependent Clp protease ATP-binding subunit ClpC
VGSHLIKKEGEVGFLPKGGGDTSHYKNISNKLTVELKRSFRVEFLNRLDSVIVFRPLSKKVAKKIARILIKEAVERLKSEHNMRLNVDEKVYDLLVEKGFSDEYGAREMRRIVTELIENPLSENILSGVYETGQEINTKVEKDKIVLN